MKNILKIVDEIFGNTSGNTYFSEMNVILLRNGDKVVPEKDVEIVRLFATGHTTKQISEMIGMNRRTLELKIGKIKAANGATTIPQLVYIFKDWELI